MAMKWPYRADRSYHGINRDDTHDTGFRFKLVVELSEFGPTERQVPYQLGVLASKIGDFGWGYNGTGTSATADAILRDALDLGPDDDLNHDLREDFCEDVAAHFTEEFIIRRGAVIRWVRGWAAEHGITDLPRIVTNPPPVRRDDYERRPESIRNEQDRERARRRR